MPHPDDSNQEGPPPTPPPASDANRGPNPIGVPNVVYDPAAGEYVPFAAQVPHTRPGTADVLGGRGLARTAPTTTFSSVRPSYHEGDEVRLFATRSRHDIIGIQRGLIDAGLLDADDVSPGVWDESTRSAMEDVLGFANATGTGWSEALNRRIQAFREGEELRTDEADPFVSGPIMLPDYASIAQDVKSTFRQRLGREPEEWELGVMARELSNFEGQRIGNRLKAQQGQFEAENKAQRTGEDQDAGEFVDVDPAARFQEEFERRYGAELDVERSEEEFDQNFRLLMGSITSLDQAV